MEQDSLGLVQVYTGNGKGKTTAAFGLAVRASGHGLRVCILQFLKGKADCGEHQFAERFKAFEVLQPNESDFFGQPPQVRRAVAIEALAQAKDLLLARRHDVLILDEVLTAASLSLITNEDVLELIRSKPDRVELILTGRGASPEVVQAADLVTEMVPVKHPYDRGIFARKGIEY